MSLQSDLELDTAIGTSMNPAVSELGEAVRNESLAYLFEAITDEMSSTILRSAYTTFIKETRDCAAALVTPSGEVFAYPRPDVGGAVIFMGCPMDAVTLGVSDWKPGDVLIVNDPYTSKGMVLQLNDLNILKPIFSDGKLLCFAWAFSHCTDVGGSIPGSIDITNSEIVQEGLRLRPVKLYSEGCLNEEVWSIIADNCRDPEILHGDIDALIAAVNKAEHRIHGIVDKFGHAGVATAIDSTIVRSEAATREVLKGLPVGSYHFSEYFEDDFVSNAPVRINVCLNVRGDGTVELDFTGTDPQVTSAINLPSCGQRHHSFLTMALVGYVLSQSEGIHVNSGITRCMDLVLPPESLVNPSAPAAVGSRAITACRVHDAILGALIQAIPDSVPAGGIGQVAIVYVSNKGPGGTGRIAVANAIQGGMGGGPWSDGVSGCDRPTAACWNVPVETLESEVPALVGRFSLIPDSEGAGRYRGGFGIRFDVEVLEPGATVVMRGKDRHRFVAWGALGGSSGTTSDCVLYEDRELSEPSYLGKGAFHRPEVGQVVSITGGGGGGYGDPLEREPALVLRDVHAGYVSVERARSVYGVVLSGNEVDDVLTELERSSLAASRGPLMTFDYGVERTRFQDRMGTHLDDFSGWLWSLPSAVRPTAKRRFFEHLEANGTGNLSTGEFDAAIDYALDGTSTNPAHQPR